MKIYKKYLEVLSREIEITEFSLINVYALFFFLICTNNGPWKVLYLLVALFLLI